MDQVMDTAGKMGFAMMYYGGIALVGVGIVVFILWIIYLMLGGDKNNNPNQ